MFFPFSFLPKDQAEKIVKFLNKSNEKELLIQKKNQI